MRLLIGLLLFSSPLCAQDDLLRERVAELLPRLTDADAGVRLGAQTEMSKLGEAVVDYFPSDPGPELKRTLDEVRLAIRAEAEADRLQMRIRSCLDESASLWKKIVETDENGDLYERAQLIALRVRLDEADLTWVREGVLDPRARLIRKLKVQTEVVWLGFKPRTWPEFAALLSEILAVPVTLEPALSSDPKAVALNDGARNIDELLDVLTRQVLAAYEVTGDSVIIRKR